MPVAASAHDGALSPGAAGLEVSRQMEVRLEVTRADGSRPSETWA